MKNNIIPFGKYKGKEIIEVVIKDPNYIDWLKNQDWLKEDFKKQIININLGALNSKQDSPEHNKMQMDFIELMEENPLMLSFFYFTKLDEKNKLILDFSFFSNIYSYGLDDRIKSYLSINKLKLSKKNIIKYLIKKVNTINIEHKVNNFFIDAYSSFYENKLIFEFKPIISEDYMSILRQIKKYSTINTMNKSILIYNSFNSEKTDIKKIKELFLKEGILIFDYNFLKSTEFKNICEINILKIIDSKYSKLKQELESNEK